MTWPASFALQEALVCYEAGMARPKREPDAFHNLVGIACHELGMLERAVQHYKACRALQMLPHPKVTAATLSLPYQRGLNSVVRISRGSPCEMFSCP